MKNWEGLRFGKLTILSINRIDSYLQDNGKHQNIKYFNCQCDCGNTTVVRQASIHATKSCGCARIESNTSRKLDVTGEKFTRLLAKELLPNGMWLCECDCGEVTEVPVARLKNGNTKSCGCLQRDKARNSLLKKHKSRRVSLGLSEDQPISADKKLQRLEMKGVTKEILLRDEFTCMWCSRTGGELNVHHIDLWSTHPELRFDKNNLITLCTDCHKYVHNGNFFSAPNYHVSILLRGIAKEQEALAARMELSAE